MNKLYVTQLEKLVHVDNFGGVLETYYERVRPCTIVYEKNGCYYDAETNELYTKEDTTHVEGNVYINPDELIELDEFLKRHDIEFKNNLTIRKIKKYFNEKSKYKVYISRINVSKLRELTDTGIRVHAKFFENAVIYKKKTEETPYYNFNTKEKYKVLEQIDDEEQKYVGVRTGIYRFINDNYVDKETYEIQKQLKK